jgi:hypothetical protein
MENPVLISKRCTIASGADDGRFPVICNENARQNKPVIARAFDAHLPENLLAPASTAICAALTEKEAWKR